MRLSNWPFEGSKIIALNISSFDTWCPVRDVTTEPKYVTVFYCRSVLLAGLISWSLYWHTLSLCDFINVSCGNLNENFCTCCMIELSIHWPYLVRCPVNYKILDLGWTLNCFHGSWIANNSIRFVEDNVFIILKISWILDKLCWKFNRNLLRISALKWDSPYRGIILSRKLSRESYRK